MRKKLPTWKTGIKMDQSLLDYIRSLSARDTKTLTQRALKLAEETGELAKVALPFENAPATLHRIVTKHKIAEEAVDNILVSLSILHQLEYEDEDIESLMREKSLKWDNILTREGKLKDPNNIPHEIHITVNCAQDEVDRFKEACKNLELKPIVLDLPLLEGGTMLDVMTSSHFFGTTPDAIGHAHMYAAILGEYEFDAIRVKVETVPWHPAAPQDFSHILNVNCYFESHVGVVMSSDDKLHTADKLKMIAGNCHARMSRNVFKKYDNGEYIQMVTMRSYSHRHDFELQLDFLLNSLQSNGFKYEKVIQEYSIYDTNVKHDSAWIGK